MRSVVEQPPPGTGHGGGDDESEGVDEAGRQQCVAEPCAAVDLEFPSWLRLSSPTVRIGSPWSTVVGCQRPSVRVLVTTYFGSEFIRSVNGSFGSVICGQSRANAS